MFTGIHGDGHHASICTSEWLVLCLMYLLTAPHFAFVDTDSERQNDSPSSTNAGLMSKAVPLGSKSRDSSEFQWPGGCLRVHL